MAAPFGGKGDQSPDFGRSTDRMKNHGQDNGPSNFATARKVVHLSPRFRLKVIAIDRLSDLG